MCAAGSLRTTNLLRTSLQGREGPLFHDLTYGHSRLRLQELFTSGYFTYNLAEWQRGTELDDAAFRVAATIPLNAAELDSEAFVTRLSAEAEA